MSWRRSILAALVAIPLLGLLAFGLTRDPREIPSPLPGREAPSFALPRMSDGGIGSDTVRLAELRGDIVVVNFWASWCLECRYEHRPLSEVAERYADRGVRFFGVLYNDAPIRGDRWIVDMGGQSYPTLVDRGTRTAIDFGVYGVPETFFIRADGIVDSKHVGPVTEEMLVERIERMLAARSAAPVAPAGPRAPDEGAES